MRKPSMIRLDISRTADSKCARLARFVARRTRLILRAMGVTVALTVSAWGNAANLGAINVISALGQPLKAEIELSDVLPEDKPAARLASAVAYKGAGLTYPSGVQYHFDIAHRANGEPYLNVSSEHEITGSLVSLLVELSWSSGRLMREYNFMLDPQGYLAIQPNTAAPRIIAPLAPTSENEILPNQQGVAQKQPGSGKSPVTTLIVKPGDYLQKIAVVNKPADISLDRMLVALYRANADQFDGQNMNRIRAGKILRIPDREEIHNVTQTEAVADIHTQAADWNAYRQKLASAASARHETEVTGQVATGKITAPVADKTPVANESSREVLRLSKGDAPGSPLSGGSVQKNAAAEDAIAKAKALEEGKMRTALLEKNLQDMQKLAKLKSEAAALISSESNGASTVPVVAVLPVEAASDVVAASEVVASSSVVAASAVVAASHVDAASTAPVSMIDKLLYWVLGVAVLLGSAGFAFIRRRTGKVKQAARAESEEAILGAAAGSSMIDFANLHATEVNVHAEAVDPIGEAELLLTFGRDDQAEDVLKEALLHTPDNYRIHLKLLDIYAKRQDSVAFDEIANLLYASGDLNAIQQAEALEKTLLPVTAKNNQSDAADDLPGQLPAETSEVQLPDETAEAAFVQTVADEPAPASLFSIEPDILNFDPVMQEPEVLPSLDDLIFDVNGTELSALSTDQPLEEDDGMEFTLDFPQDDLEDKQSHPPINLADISLEMDDVRLPPADVTATEKTEQWHEVATKLDLAKAYQEMGDEVGSREILDEVLLEGDDAQKQEAQLLITQLS